jgi:hypothetical protein
MAGNAEVSANDFDKVRVALGRLNLLTASSGSHSGNPAVSIIP